MFVVFTLLHVGFRVFTFERYTRFAQNVKMQNHCVIFFTRRFAVDPGDGEHISYKINHSATRANLCARADKNEDGDDIIVFRAARVGIYLFASYICVA